MTTSPERGTSSDSPTPRIPSPDNSVRASYLPGRRQWITVAVCAAGIAMVRWAAAWGQVEGASVLDNAFANIATLILTFIALTTMAMWLFLQSRFSRSARNTCLIVLAATPILLIALLRIEKTSGNLFPTFRFRWSKRADELLSKPTPVAMNSVVDLLSSTQDDFPQFLGPQRVPFLPQVNLDADWNLHPPKLLWRKPIGAGWSAFSVVNGFAVTMEQRGEEELVTCYEAATGELKWSHAINKLHKTILGGVGPRSTPTIHEGRVYAAGATGILRCLDGRDGSLIWSQNLLELLGTTQSADESVVAWGRSASPLIVGNRVVIPAGGKPNGPFVSLFAFDKNTGEKMGEAGTTQISFASPVLATLSGVAQIISVNESNVTSHNPDDGKLLWSFDWPGRSNANASTSQPVVIDSERLLLSKGYGAGAALIKISSVDGQSWTATELWHKRNVLKTKFANVVVRDGHAFALSDGILECVEIETGRSRWKRGRYDHGQILGVGQHLLVLSETGELVLVPATPERPEELGRIQALNGQTWNNLCLFGKLLLIRNGEEAACYELTLKPSSP